MITLYGDFMSNILITRVCTTMGHVTPYVWGTFILHPLLNRLVNQTIRNQWHIRHHLCFSIRYNLVMQYSTSEG